MRRMLSVLALAGACSAEEPEAPQELAVDTGVQAPPPAQVWFNSTASWPPALLNNPQTSQAGQYRSPFWGYCPNGVLPGVVNRTLTNASSYTGLLPTSVQQYTCPEPTDPVWEMPFLQLDNASKTVGIWLNSTKTSGGTLTASTPAFELITPQTPWDTPTSQLSVSFRMKVQRFSWPGAGTDGPVVPYAVAWVILRRAGTLDQVWYGASMFDPRPCAEWVMLDVGTNMPMIASCYAAGTTFAHLGAGSASKRSTASSAMQYYDLNISRADLRRGLQAYNVWAAANGRSVWPTDDQTLAAMQVTALALNPEVADHDRTRYDQLVVNMADGYPTSAPLDIWYQRTDRTGWQYGKRITVPGGGGWMTHTISLYDVLGFSGNLSAIALNPQYPGGTGSFGFEFVELRNGAGRAMRSWPLNNPAPPQWSCDGSSCRAWDMVNFWTSPTAWGGQLATTPSFQITGFTPVPVDPAGTLGIQFKDIQLAKLP